MTISTQEGGVAVTQEGREHERSRLPAGKQLSGSYFAGAYSSEHFAGGEFVVGAAFAAWGSSAGDILFGLLLGNLMAVLSWGLICSPVATRARITLYHYLEQLAGGGTTRIYSLLNGVIFAVIAGGMITISASAVRAMTHIPDQTHWYPTSALFVVLALLLGAVTIFITVRGFAGLSRFAKLCAPWLMTIFVLCGLASLPIMMALDDHRTGFFQLFDTHVWTGHTPDGSAPFSMWQIAAFAWGLNLPLHLGMGDLSTLRYARRSQYGFYSICAAFGGHFVAWVCASILGATAAMMLSTSIGTLDIGGIVVPILGIAGMAAVILASITTAVPSLYRAGLAFQSIFRRHSRTRVTVVIGSVTTVVACFPLIFLQWLNLMAYFNILLAPIGAIIAAEHFLLPRLGIAPFWRKALGLRHNHPAIISWAAGTLLAAVLIISGLIHLFFIFIPVWLVCLVLYTLLVSRQPQARATGAAHSPQALYSAAYGDDDGSAVSALQRSHTAPAGRRLTTGLAWGSLTLMILATLLLWWVPRPLAWLSTFQVAIAVLTLCYFVTASWQTLPARRAKTKTLSETLS